MKYKTIIKTDGSARNGTFGLGIHAIYIEDGKILRRASYSQTIPSLVANGNRAELEAIKYALLNVPHLGQTEIQSDSSYAVNVTNKGNKIKKNLDLIQEIRNLLKITGATLSWIPRTKNKIADQLSKKASKEKTSAGRKLN